MTFRKASLPIAALLLAQSVLAAQPTPDVQPIMKISPTKGSIKGGSEILITGVVPLEPLEVLVDGLPCKNKKKISKLAVTCTLPPHPVGTAKVFIKDATGHWIESKNSFLFISYLKMDSDVIILPPSKKLTLKATDGEPPYTYALVSGTGQVEKTTGVFTAPDVAGTGVLSVTDSLGHVAVASYLISAPLSSYPESVTLQIGEHFQIAPLGGSPPYESKILSGEGHLSIHPPLFVAPQHPGETVIQLSDQVNETYDLKVTTINSRTDFSSRQIATGDRHSCGVFGSDLKCWGDNRSGQLGDGTLKESSFPVKVKQIDGKKVTALAAGADHTCAVVETALLCWGANHYGQLGDGTLLSHALPMPVLGFASGVFGVATGENHTCAASIRGIFCWGRNDHGQLGGYTEKEISSFPTVVQPITSHTHGIFAHFSNTCVAEGQSLKCWGDGLADLLRPRKPKEDDEEDKKDQDAMIAFADMGGDVKEVAVGWAHLCALVNSGVKCWGFNGSGAVGGSFLVTQKDRLGGNELPVEKTFASVLGLEQGVTSLSAGQYHSCAIQSERLWCWGDNYYGEVGDGSRSRKLTPVMIQGLPGAAKEVVSSVSHSCALLDAGRQACWGNNQFGQLGDLTYTLRTTPVLVVPSPPPPPSDP